MDKAPASSQIPENPKRSVYVLLRSRDTLSAGLPLIVMVSLGELDIHVPFWRITAPGRMRVSRRSQPLWRWGHCIELRHTPEDVLPISMMQYQLTAGILEAPRSRRLMRLLMRSEFRC